MKFRYNQKVYSAKGFFQGFTGKVKDYAEVKGEVFYKVEGRFHKDDKLETRTYPESELKVSWF